MAFEAVQMPYVVFFLQNVLLSWDLVEYRPRHHLPKHFAWIFQIFCGQSPRMKATLILTLLFSSSLLTAIAADIVPQSPRMEKVENEGLLFTDNKAGVTGVDGYFSLPIGKQTAWFF